jgi:transposase InsO family protein
VAVMIDLYARRVFGWALMDTPDTYLEIKALSDSLERRVRLIGFMFH